MEDVRPVPGYEKEYGISLKTKEGICISFNYRHTGKPKELSNNPRKDGRLYWGLWKDGKGVKQQAAVWIALTYPELVENEWFEGAEIDHKDTDRLNNQPFNLKWVTTKDNANNPITKQHMSQSHVGLHIPGFNDYHPVAQYNLDGTFVRRYDSIQEAEKTTGIYHSNISKVCQGKRKTAGGFKWEVA